MDEKNKSNRSDLSKNLLSEDNLKNPIMDLAARFWEEERYKVFKSLYPFFRSIDDQVDNWKANKHGKTEGKKQQIISNINNWVNTFTNYNPKNIAEKQIVETIKKFQFPSWLWESFSKAMLYDLDYEGFRTFPIFLEYSEGAAIAPASIFVHLCGIRKEKGQYITPPFDIRPTAKPAGLFCYLVHIIRDFQKDQNNNLNYFSNDVLKEYGLKPSILKEVATGGAINYGFRKLMKKYYNFAEFYQCKTRQAIDRIADFLEPQYRLSIEIVFDLYSLIFKKIDVINGAFTATELNLASKEVKNQINRTISIFESNNKNNDTFCFKI